jgi:hypothetical protein
MFPRPDPSRPAPTGRFDAEGPLLRVLGNPKRFCDGVTRRDLLHVGAASLLGIPSTAAFATRGQAAETGGPGFGRAKRCILVFPFGAQPQHETFDPKPDAPVEVQGEMKGIPTALPGVQIGEGLPRLAQVLDRACVIRSLTHPFPLHCTAYALTGMPAYTTDVEGRPRDTAVWPYMGSVAEYFLSEKKTDLASNGHSTPWQVAVPWKLNSRAEDYVPLAGVYGSYLGQQYDPLWADFDGPGLREVPKCRHEQAKTFVDPYGGIAPTSKFVVAGATTPADTSLTASRFDLRRTLLTQIDSERVRLDQSTAVRTYTHDQQRAISLLTSNGVREALDVTKEPEAVRAEYGMTLFGQSCLAARRLIEAGVPFVTVFWDAYGTYFSGAWDTHQNHYPRLREYLLPGFDAGLAGLLIDLERRGLLDDTLVICMSEHGRTPKIDSGPKGAARHHWSRVYSGLMAGGGTPRGTVVGASDRDGGDVLHTPVSPKDIQATAYHLLGIPPHATFPDPVGRPLPAAGSGEVRSELIG